MVLRPSMVAVCLLLASGCATSNREYVSEDELQAIVLQHNMTAKDLQRILCRREIPTGSHLPTTRCRTVAQLRRERDAINRGRPTHTQGGAGAP